jgi:GTP-binding protein
MNLPVVAIVGAPNVGKSTLFNRLIGRRRAIVSDEPGVTRDRNEAVCDLFGREVTLVDTGGMVPGTPDALTRMVREEALRAVRDADLILFVVDGRTGPTPLDLEVAALLRPARRPIVPVANKIDAESVEAHGFEAYRLGLGEVVMASAEQGRGIDDLVERIRATLPAGAGEMATEPGVPLAIVGRPNVGKSSLFNRLVGEERALVSPAPGTTRDPVGGRFEHAGVTYRVVDTAGIRRRTRGAAPVERLSVMLAERALAEARLAVAVVDAAAGVEHQDRAILGMVAARRTPAVIAANKIDLLPARAALDPRLEELRSQLGFARFVPILGVSAKTGRGLDRLLAALREVREESLRRIPTPELNRALHDILAEKQPPSDRGREVRLHYIAQTGVEPPRFALFGNGRPIPEAYRRFIETRLRARLGLTSTPIALSFRRRAR